MSFFDNFAANINSNKTFFDQIDLSKNASQNFLTNRKTSSREAFGKAQLDTGKERNNVELNSTSSRTIEKKEASFEVKKKDVQSKEKKDFFKTAKEIFTDYKKKTDKKDSQEELKEELETADAALDLIFQTVTQPIVEKELSLELGVNLRASTELSVDAESEAAVGLDLVGLDLVEHESQINADPELLDFFLGKAKDQLNTEIEDITQEIVKLDLSTQEGVKAIIDLSSQVEKLQDLELNIKELEAKLDLQTKLDLKAEAQELKIGEIKPEIKVLVETKISSKIEEVKNLDLQEIKAQIDTSEETKDIKQILDEIKAGLKQSEAQNNGKKTNSDYNVKVLQDYDAKAEGTRKTDFTKADIEILEIKETTKTSKSNTKQEKALVSQTITLKHYFQKRLKLQTLK